VPRSSVKPASNHAQNIGFAPLSPLRRPASTRAISAAIRAAERDWLRHALRGVGQPTRGGSAGSEPTPGTNGWTSCPPTVASTCSRREGFGHLGRALEHVVERREQTAGLRQARGLGRSGDRVHPVPGRARAAITTAVKDAGYLRLPARPRRSARPNHPSRNPPPLRPSIKTGTDIHGTAGALWSPPALLVREKPYQKVSYLLPQGLARLIR
jgi:hypothetical protein